MKKTNKARIAIFGILLLSVIIVISAGDVIFQGGKLDLSDDLAVDTNTLYVDTANNKVGIGTSTPTEMLTLGAGGNIKMQDGNAVVWGSGTGGTEFQTGNGASHMLSWYTNSVLRMMVNSQGNVGIGTKNITDMLTLGAGGNIKMQDGNAVVWGSGTGGTEFQTGSGASHTLSWYTNSVLRMMVNSQGNVGIGTKSPTEKLEVAGNVKATAFSTGDITFNKDDKPVWRMYEDENGLYLESLITGKRYRFVLQEME